MQTCPHCHQPVTAGSRFCEHCGYDLTQAPAATAGRRRANSQSPRSHHHWLGKVLGGVIVLAVIVVAFLGVGFYHRQAGKPKQITTITDAITANQSNDLAKHLTSDDPSLKITGDTVQPFLDYTRKHPQYVKNMRADLLDSGETRDHTFKLVTAGHTLGVLPVYKLQVATMHPHLSTNAANATILANNDAVITAKNDHFTYTAGPLFPGHYTFKLSGTRDKASVTTDLLGSQDRNQAIALTAKAAKTTGSSTTTTTSNFGTGEQPHPNDQSSSATRGQLEADMSSDAQEAIDAASDDYDFDPDDERYTVSEPHPQVLEIKTYDRDTGVSDGTYRYDQVHSIVSLYNASTGKFETNDDDDD
ncbi:TcaA second domain-containing protein [Levilactobacillus namurensis]|uniref:TcaA second domain-containing protein n=1 Tax=Levilactobacillus namurensis TaxID=380393 RepID=UPI000467E7E0|nr:zinc-ribbon domain-containing protein [Levilactobacillus namurensis]